MKQVVQIKAGERGVNVTLYRCINALGLALPPAFVFPKVKCKAHMLNGASSGNSGLATKSGYINRDLFVPLPQHFISYMNISQQNLGLLICDNDSSHITIASMTVTKESGLTLLTLPPHCSHRMQLLVLGVFVPFKRFYAYYANVWQRSNPGRVITIYKVASLSSFAIITAFIPKHTKWGFKSTGIYPLNSKVFPADIFLPSSVTNRPLEVETSSQENGL